MQSTKCNFLQNLVTGHGDENSMQRPSRTHLRKLLWQSKWDMYLHYYTLSTNKYGMSSNYVYRYCMLSFIAPYSNIAHSTVTIKSVQSMTESLVLQFQKTYKYHWIVYISSFKNTTISLPLFNNKHRYHPLLWIFDEM